MHAQKLGAAIERLTMMYRVHAESADRVDRDSAEIFRVGAIVLRDARLRLLEAREAPPGQPVEDVDPEAVVATFRKYAEDYCRTGVRLDDDYVMPVGPVPQAAIATAQVALGMAGPPTAAPAAAVAVAEKEPDKPRPKPRPLPPPGPPAGFAPDRDHVDTVAEFIADVLA